MMKKILFNTVLIWLAVTLTALGGDLNMNGYSVTGANQISATNQISVKDIQMAKTGNFREFYVDDFSTDPSARGWQYSGNISYNVGQIALDWNTSATEYATNYVGMQRYGTYRFYQSGADDHAPVVGTPGLSIIILSNNVRMMSGWLNVAGSADYVVEYTGQWDAYVISNRDSGYYLYNFSISNQFDNTTEMADVMPNGTNCDIGSKERPFHRIVAHDFDAVGSSYLIDGKEVLALDAQSNPVIYNLVIITDTNKSTNTDAAVTYGQMTNYVAQNSGGGSGPYIYNTSTVYSILATNPANNISSGNYVSVLGGVSNRANTYGATIAGGIGNFIKDGNNISDMPCDVVGGGYSNYIYTYQANSGYGRTIAGGRFNTVSMGDGTIGGGVLNVNDSVQSVIGGGAYNYIGFSSGGSGNTVGGGYYNTITYGNSHCFIGGGRNNNIASGGSGAAILSGQYNYLNNYGCATIVGGEQNYAYDGYDSVIGGGGYNKIKSGPVGRSDGSVIAGGYYNDVRGWIEVVSGGYYNSNSAPGSVIGGGTYNTIDGTGTAWTLYHNFIGGGSSNIIKESYYASILGGWSNKMDHVRYSTILGGRGAIITNDGCLAFGEGATPSAPSQIVFKASGGMTIDGPVTTPAINYSDTNIWEDILFPASVWNPPGTPSAATLAFNVGPSADMLALGFADSAENVAVGRAQLRHDWRTAQPDVYVHVHWMPNSTITGVVVMALKYTEAGIGATYYPSVTNIMQFGATNEQWKHKMATFPVLLATNNPTVSHGINMTITRLGNSNDDTWAGTCYVTDIDMHFRIKGSGASFIPASP